MKGEKVKLLSLWLSFISAELSSVLSNSGKDI